MRRVICKILLYLVIFHLAACAIGPKYKRPDLNLPKKYNELTTVDHDIADLAWQKVFDDTRVHELVTLALENNKDLKIAVARIDEAKALLGFTRADQYPNINITGGANRTDPGSQADRFTLTTINNFRATADLYFELDLWGKLRRATEAQAAQLFAAKYNYRSIYISLIAQVVNSYLILNDLDSRLAISRRTLKNRQDATKLMTTRYKGGIISELDVNQAQIEEGDAAALVAGFEREMNFAESALSVLLGHVPYDIERKNVIEEKFLKLDIPGGFPAKLLERRPDVMAAEEQAKAATARVAVARAERLPSLNLLGFIGKASSTDSTFDSSGARTWSIGGNLLSPLLDFGKRKSNLLAAKARRRQALRNYELTVLKAIQEVEDSLVSIRTYRVEYEARKSQKKAAENATKLSRARYDDGLSPYLEVLDSERSLFEAELRASSSLQLYLSSIVRLYKALGGGWNN